MGANHTPCTDPAAAFYPIPSSPNWNQLHPVSQRWNGKPVASSFSTFLPLVPGHRHHRRVPVRPRHQSLYGQCPSGKVTTSAQRSASRDAISTLRLVPCNLGPGGWAPEPFLGTAAGLGPTVCPKQGPRPPGTHSGPPTAETIPLAHHSSSKVGSTRWAGTTRGLAPFRVLSGPLLAPRAVGAILSSKETPDGSQRGVLGPNCTGFHLGSHSGVATNQAWGLSGPSYPGYEFGPTLGPPACCLLAGCMLLVETGPHPGTLPCSCKANC